MDVRGRQWSCADCRLSVCAFRVVTYPDRLTRPFAFLVQNRAVISAGRQLLPLPCQGK